MHTATRYSALFLIAFVVAGCTAKKHPGDLGVAELLQRGREFDGKRVAVIAYYEAGLEESCLYPNDQVRTRYDSLIDGVFSPQIWVEPGLRRVSRLKNRYVRVLGTFHYRPEFTRKIEKRDDGREFESITPEGYGHMGLCPAEITGVTLFRPLR